MNLSDRQLADELVGMFGVRHAAILIGWAVLWSLAGARTREEMLAARLGGLSTRYKVLADFRMFRDRLVEKGYDVGGGEDGVAELVVRVKAA